jgi:hypothetical protein
MGRQSILIAFIVALALALVAPVSNGVPQTEPRDSQTQRDDLRYIWDKDLLGADDSGGIDDYLAQVETCVRSAVTVVKAILNAFVTVLMAVAKVLLKAAVKMAVAVAHWLLQLLIS